MFYFSKLKGFADDNFKCDKNDRKLYKGLKTLGWRGGGGGEKRNCLLLAISPFLKLFQDLKNKGFFFWKGLTILTVSQKKTFVYMFFFKSDTNDGKFSKRAVNTV